MRAAAVVMLLCSPWAAHAACKVSDIQIMSMRARFADECRRSPCPVMKGVAVLRNNCTQATGVKLQIVGLDKAGAPVAARELWPASTRNIAPGEYTFSVDHYLEHDPAIVRFRLTPVAVKTW
jgi:hypothetical protein